MKWAFNQVKEAIKYINDNDGVEHMFNMYPSIEGVINSNNKTQAKELVSKYSIKVLEPAII